MCLYYTGNSFLLFWSYRSVLLIFVYDEKKRRLVSSAGKSTKLDSLHLGWPHSFGNADRFRREERSPIGGAIMEVTIFWSCRVFGIRLSYLCRTTAQRIVRRNHCLRNHGVEVGRLQLAGIFIVIIALVMNNLFHRQKKEAGEYAK